MITWRGLCTINTVRTNEQIFFITFLTKTLIYFWRYSFDFKQNLTGVSWIKVSAEVSPFTFNRNHKVWRFDESKSSYRNWDSNLLYRYSVFNNRQICAMSNRLALLFTYSILWQIMHTIREYSKNVQTIQSWTILDEGRRIVTIEYFESDFNWGKSMARLVSAINLK